MSETFPERLGLKHSFLNRLTKISLIQKVAAALRVHKILDRCLRILPIRGSLLRSGSIYRISSYSAWLMAKELFQFSVYRPALSQGFTCRTFIDLGCHAGYFPLLLNDVFFSKNPPNQLAGLCVDANPLMTAETAWHMEANGLCGVHVHHGMAGGGSAKSRTFYVNSTSFLSSAFPQKHPEQKLADPLLSLDVPVLDISHLWQEAHGDAKIDLLKIDIEGSELDFIRENPDLLRQTKRVIVECHKWLVSEADLSLSLTGLGFRQLQRLNEEEHTVVLIFEQ